MIRRISKHNDLKDYIKSCPSGVIDDIYKIEYYIQGYNTVIECSFIKSGELLEVTLPTSLLGTLQNGILMRRAYYKVVDSSYPDGYYNLEFEDCMNIWLGDYESEEPIIPEYVTEEELASELTSYATKDWVDSQQFLTSETIPSDIATQSWVSSNFLSATALSGYATEQFVTDSLSDYATASWVISQSFAKQSEVNDQFRVIGDAFSAVFIDLSSLSSEIGDYGSIISDIQGSVSSVYSYVDEEIGYVYSYIDGQSYATEQFVTDSLSGYATASWVISQSFAKQSEVNDQFRVIGDAFSAVFIDMSSLSSEIGDYGSIISDIQGSVSELYSLCVEFATISDISDVYSYIDEQSYVTEGWIESEQFVTESYLSDEGYIKFSSIESYNDSYPLVNMSDSGIFIAGYFDYGAGISGPGGILVTESGEVGLYHYDLEDQAGTFSAFATQDWVQEQGYLTSTGLSGLATQSWVSSNFLSSGALSGYATEQFVTSSLSGYATQSWVSSNFLSSSWVEDELSSYALVYDRRNDYIYESDKVYIGNGGLLFFDYMGDENGVSGVYLSSSTAGIYGVDSVTFEYVYEPFATQSWVSSNFLSSGALSGYATEQFVTSSLSGYATQSWATSQFLEESKIWTGSQAAWELMTAEQQAVYTIALITE